jgi:hypothetical protein
MKGSSERETRPSTISTSAARRALFDTWDPFNVSRQTTARPAAAQRLQKNVARD